MVYELTDATDTSATFHPKSLLDAEPAWLSWCILVDADQRRRCIKQRPAV